MRTQKEVYRFIREIADPEAMRCPLPCGGKDLSCPRNCRGNRDYTIRAFTACIPRRFWWIEAEDVSHNREIFDGIILPYVQRMPIALKLGAGLFLSGDNGTGKTYFLSYVLSRPVRANAWTCYYTTSIQLWENITKGWKDPEVRDRLESMLARDFVVIDELGKASIGKTGNSRSLYLAELERILKLRAEMPKPTLFASNSSLGDLCASQDDDGLGETIASLIKGSCRPVVMEHGDFRQTKKSEIASQMGWG